MMSLAPPQDNEPIPRPKAKATVLVVDGNAASRRFVELALGRVGTLAVEVAEDTGAAFEVLKAQLVDLILCDTDLRDMSGLEFHRVLSQETRFRNLAFVFLSADSDIKTKVSALQAGVDDYIVKPCDAAELIARVEALVARRRRLREDRRSRGFDLAGDLSVMTLADLLGIIEMGKRSGTLSIATQRAVGRLHFDKGRIVHVVCGNLVGADAFHRLFREHSGQFEFTPGYSKPEACTVEESTTGLILEAARRYDVEHARLSGELPRTATTRPPPRDNVLIAQATREFDPGTGEIVHLFPRGGTPQPSIMHIRRAPALVADSMLAAQFELALGDPFALGELSMWTEADLADWTQREIGQNRLHLHLVASMEVGVSVILALAGAPSESWVLLGLLPTRKALGLTFRLRHDRVVDLVLIDAEAPTSLLPSLRRVPSVMFICPPGGHLLGLGTTARFELEQLLGSLRPTAVVGVGNQALPSRLAEMKALRNGSKLRCMEGELGDGGEDLRSLLIKGVRLWASTAASDTDRPPTT